MKKYIVISPYSMIYFWKSQHENLKKIDQLFRSSHYGEIRTIFDLRNRFSGIWFISRFKFKSKFIYRAYHPLSSH